MAHEISENLEGKQEMFYTGELPWHGLGTRIDQEAATSQQAIKASGLDWTVSKYPLMVQTLDDPAAPGTIYEDKYALARDDMVNSNNPRFFGVVTDKYTVLQNREAFEFFDSIVGEGEAAYHTAGALFGGRKVWLLAKLPETVEVVGDDIIDQYLLINNSHDGNRSVEIFFTPVRVVCNNTLTAAKQTSMRNVYIKHTQSLHSNLSSAARLMGIVKTASERLAEVYKSLAKVPVTSKESIEYFKKVWEPSEALQENQEPSGARTRYENRIAQVSGIFEGSPTIQGINGARGTMWGAYNAVTEYVDHHMTYNDMEAKMDSVLMGTRASLKEEALEIAKKAVA